MTVRPREAGGSMMWDFFSIRFVTEGTDLVLRERGQASGRRPTDRPQRDSERRTASVSAGSVRRV